MSLTQRRFLWLLLLAILFVAVVTVVILFSLHQLDALGIINRHGIHVGIINRHGLLVG